jgi:hypothetical protein
MNTLSVSDIPSSALAEDDPFYILTPDLRPINGSTESFGRYLFSSRYGSMYSLAGGSAKDFSISPLYTNSAATGDEGLVFAGNDVIYARAGSIESLSGAETFGDVENDDVSRQIAFDIRGFEKFRLIYDAFLKKLYVFPDGSDTVWVFHKPIQDQLAKDVTQLRPGAVMSPWAAITTTHSTGFQPTTVWSMRDPSTNHERVYFGGTDGSLYAFDNDTYEGDGGTTDIVTTRLSKNFVPPKGKFNRVSGWVRYRSGSNVTLTLTFEYGGFALADQVVTVILPANTGADYWGGDVWFSGDFYFNQQFDTRLESQKYSAAGHGSECRVRASVTSSNSFSIAEIGIEFDG